MDTLTDDRNVRVRVRFWKTVEEYLDKFWRGERLILLRDMNARVGDEQMDWLMRHKSYLE